ncbi:MAG: Succinate dehydrogenase iron-sulfur subunit [bacterium ADurb.Bin374]|nr:MAG: Succinate dehydrogenase iron-sulfur subunit [bacterium ADurb.Bin374]
MTKRTFSIYRYDPDKDAKPYMQTIEVELDGSERMLLDALMKLKALDPTISFRRSCREGVCGSDAMNINGKNGLACLTNMLTLPGTIVLKPLPGLPVIRDLIVDMTQFFKQYNSIKPYLINDTVPPEKERLQSPEEREELNGLYECILCASCSTSCPSFWWNPDKFVGPAGLLQAYRFLADSREIGDDFARSGVLHERSDGNPDRCVERVGTDHVFRSALFAWLRAIDALIAQFIQRVQVARGYQDDIAAPTAVTARRAAERYELLAAEGNHAVAAFSGFNFDYKFINEFHPEIIPQTP